MGLRHLAPSPKKMKKTSTLALLISLAQITPVKTQDLRAMHEETRRKRIENLSGFALMFEAMTKLPDVPQGIKDFFGPLAANFGQYDIITKHLNRSSFEKAKQDGFFSEQTLNIAQSVTALTLVIITSTQGCIKLYKHAQKKYAKS